MMKAKAVMAFRYITETGKGKSSKVIIMTSILELHKRVYSFILNQHG